MLSKKRKKRAQQARPVLARSSTNDAADYWSKEIQKLGRNVVFVDSGAILETLTPGDETFSNFFDGLVDRLVTSTYVVAETVRRLVKSKPHEFAGPSGERNVALARHFLVQWLVERGVIVLCVPESVYMNALAQYQTKQVSEVGCDLTDTISYIIVRGLGQSRIVAKDQHFLRLGLLRLP